MRLRVFSVYGREIELSVQPDDLVHTIKMRIEDTEGIPFPVQKFHLEHLILCYKDRSYSRGRLAATTIPLSYHTTIQKGIGRTFQKSAKRMKASLGVLPSTPVAFL